jgi:F-type H+-transporting ATPase subunit a
MIALVRTFLAFVLILPLAGVLWANEPEHDPGAAAHSDTAAVAHGEAHDSGIGGTLVHILEHHLVDSHEIDLLGYVIHLPEFEIAGLTFLTKHQLWWLISLVLVFVLVSSAAKQRSEVPTGFRNVLEILATFIRDEVLRPNLHGKADAFLPYFLTLFTCILFSNLLGLLPWGASATGNIGTTAGLALCTLGLMAGMGIKENGIGGFLHSFAPPGVPGWLMPLIIIVEIASFFIRPFALTIRLFANMLAGHAVIAVLLGLIITPLFAIPSITVATGVMVLEIIVALIQAYIFTMLSAVFIGLAIHPH